jgi:hypothetical protein
MKPRVAGGTDLDCSDVVLYAESDGKRPRQMKHLGATVSVMCLKGLLSVSPAGAASEGLHAAASSTVRAIGNLDQHVLKNEAMGQTSAVPPAPSTFSKVFRDTPSISGNYSVGGTTLKPYIGAGFGSGYASDLERSLNGGPSIQSDSGLRSLFGQGLTPSEFQMGIRIPF